MKKTLFIDRLQADSERDALADARVPLGRESRVLVAGGLTTDGLDRPVLHPCSMRFRVLASGENVGDHEAHLDPHARLKIPNGHLLVDAMNGMDGFVIFEALICPQEQIVLTVIERIGIWIAPHGQQEAKYVLSSTKGRPYSKDYLAQLVENLPQLAV